mgnify:CR=1 FL=1
MTVQKRNKRDWKKSDIRNKQRKSDTLLMDSEVQTYFIGKIKEYKEKNA